MATPAKITSGMRTAVARSPDAATALLAVVGLAAILAGATDQHPPSGTRTAFQLLDSDVSKIAKRNLPAAGACFTRRPR